MATLTIRRLDDATHDALRRRAAANGRSVEAEVRAILDMATRRPHQNFLLTLHDTVVAAEGGADLPLPPRTDYSSGANLS